VRRPALVTAATLLAVAACAGPHGAGMAAPAPATGAVVAAGTAPSPAAAPVLEEQVSGVTAVLQAVSAVSDEVAWVTGHAAVVLRTTDGGASWERLHVPGADSLEFRDVEAFDADVAYLLAAGPGARSRIFRTGDGGRTWSQQFVNAEPRAFYDCFAFFDRRRGVVVSDAVDGRLIVRRTGDGGAHWDVVPSDGIPPAQAGEGAFAASGTCLASLGDRLAWIGTGSTAEARVYRSTDAGRRWEVTAVPVVSGEAAGVTSVAFRDPAHGVALGGRIAAAADTANQVAVTTDGGATWTRAGRPPFPGAVFGSAYVPRTRPATLVAAGPGGLAMSRDDGATWSGLSTDAYWAVGFASARTGWAVGPRGRITKIRLP
jgi:photosystem II stability/assembly factor-like uncharacterized protein